MTPRRSFRRSLSVAALVLGGVSAALSAPVAAEHWSPPSTVWVQSSGHTSDRLFLDAWRTRPAVVGEPITEEFRSRAGFVSQPESDRIVQYYRNVALAYVPEAPAGDQVQTLDLGRLALEERLDKHPTQTLLRADAAAACEAEAEAADAECRAFAETGQTLRGPFLAFWEANDGGRWFGAPLTEAFRAPDGSMIQYFENGALLLEAGGAVRPMPIGEQIAKLQQLATEPIPQPDGVPAYDEGLFVEPPEPEPAEDEAAPTVAIEEATALGDAGPGPQQGAWKEIVVSLSGQRMWAYENGDLVTSTSVSTGTGVVPEAETPIGSFQILSKYDLQDMEGDINGYYFVEDVPDVMYFDDLGNALHGTYWHSNFGTPMSHGCVNLPLDVAAFLYDWAPVGTAVSVIG